MTDDQVRIEAILADRPGGKASLVEILMEIKAQTGTVTVEAVRTVSDRLGLGIHDVHGVAGFFSGFERRPLGAESRRKPSGKFDPWREPPCALWSRVR